MGAQKPQKIVDADFVVVDQGRKPLPPPADPPLFEEWLSWGWFARIVSLLAGGAVMAVFLAVGLFLRDLVTALLS